MYRTLLMLNVVLNCIVFWNTLSVQQVVEQLRAEGIKISQEELRHITPTMINHIDLIGEKKMKTRKRENEKTRHPTHECGSFLACFP